jgi:hypothetical protein
MEKTSSRQLPPNALPASLVARYVSAEKALARLRQENAALRKQARPRASAASLRRVAEEAERIARERGMTGMAIEPWVSSLRCDIILSQLLHMRLHEVRRTSLSLESRVSSERSKPTSLAAAGLEAERGMGRPFLEALGATTQDVIVELVRELPIAELLADALLDGAAALPATS